MTTYDPAANEYYERRPGSGIWYRLPKTAKPASAYSRLTCGSCDGEFMGLRRSRASSSRLKGRYCSPECESIGKRTSRSRLPDPAHPRLPGAG